MSKHAIDQIIDILSETSAQPDRITKYLDQSIGRVFRNNASKGQVWQHGVTSNLHHVVDWIEAAIINDEDWLKRLDDKGRVKKLMKFSSIDQMLQEADKAMLKAAQKNPEIQLSDSDERLLARLDNGYAIVQMLTPEALDRESSYMQHCIGAGAYDDLVKQNKRTYASLRDPHGKPHITFELFHDIVRQFQGKQNKLPSQKYIDIFKAIVPDLKWNINSFSHVIGMVSTKDGCLHDIHNIPENSKLIGYIKIKSDEPIELPQGLHVEGTLRVESYSNVVLSSGLNVSDNLVIEAARLKGLPADANVGNNIFIISTEIGKLPDDLKVYGSLRLDSSKLGELPKNLQIERSLYLDGSDITELPACMHVGETLSIANTAIKELPEHLVVGRNLIATKSSLERIQETVKIGQSVDLKASQIRELPKNLEVNGYLDISDTMIEELPEGLKVNGRLDVSGSKLKCLPEDIHVQGEIDITSTGITNLPLSIPQGSTVIVGRRKIDAWNFQDIHLRRKQIQTNLQTASYSR